MHKRLLSKHLNKPKLFNGSVHQDALNELKMHIWAFLTWNVWCRCQHRYPMGQHDEDRLGWIMSTQQTSIVRLHARKPSWPYNENKWHRVDALNLNTPNIAWLYIVIYFHNTDAYYVWRREWQWNKHAFANNGIVWGVRKGHQNILMKCTQNTSDEMKSMLVMLNVMNDEGTAWIHTW